MLYERRPIFNNLSRGSMLKRKTCLVPRSDGVEGQGQMSNAKVTRNKKRHFSALSAACVRFTFGKPLL